MAKQQVKVLLNVGLDDQEQYGLPELYEDDVASVTEEQAHVLMSVLKVAKPYNAKEEEEHQERVREFDERVMENQIAQEQIREELQASVRDRLAKGGGTRMAARRMPVRQTRRAAEPEVDDEADSPVADMTVPEATDKISRMTSKDRLQEIADTDTRQGVKDAASKRLQELG